MKQSSIILVGAAAMAALGAALFLGAGGRTPAQVASPSGSTIIEVRVGDVALRVRAHHLRDPQDRMGGRIDELHLAADAENFDRPPSAQRPLPPGETEAAPDIVYLTLQPRETTVAPADRMAKLYARFLKRGAEPVQIEGGLMMRAFEQKSPYEHEELFFNPREGGLFAARCLRPPEDVEAGNVMATGCIAEMRLSGVDVRLRFSASLLGQWEHLAMETTRFVAAMVQK